MEDMEYCGAKFDKAKNAVRGETYLNTADSKVKIMVVPTNEELSIARETKILTENK
jgi:acetate kinase